MRVCVADILAIDDMLLDRFIEGMPKMRRERAVRYRRRSDKALAAAAYQLLKYMLKTAYDFVPTQAQWAIGENGKPYLLGTDVQFNISHSGDMVMCAVCEGPVGTDIEKMRPVSRLVAERIMSAEEKRVYDSTDEKDALFFAVWTLKEAYIKYTGQGLRTPLQSLTAYPNGGTVQTNAKSCCLKSFDSIGGYRAAVCADMPYEGVPERVDIAALTAL